MERENIDCGTATPEAYDDVSMEALHVLNVHFIGSTNVKRVIRFTCARVLHFRRHLPAGASQRIRFDVRGQRINSKDLESSRQAIMHEASKNGILVSVEFLTN